MKSDLVEEELKDDVQSPVKFLEYTDFLINLKGELGQDKEYQ